MVQDLPPVALRRFDPESSLHLAEAASQGELGERRSSVRLCPAGERIEFDLAAQGPTE